MGRVKGEINRVDHDSNSDQKPAVNLDRYQEQVGRVRVGSDWGCEDMNKLCYLRQPSGRQNRGLNHW